MKCNNVVYRETHVWASFWTSFWTKLNKKQALLKSERLIIQKWYNWPAVKLIDLFLIMMLLYFSLTMIFYTFLFTINVYTTFLYTTLLHIFFSLNWYQFLNALTWWLTIYTWLWIALVNQQFGVRWTRDIEIHVTPPARNWIWPRAARRGWRRGCQKGGRRLSEEIYRRWSNHF